MRENRIIMYFILLVTLLSCNALEEQIENNEQKDSYNHISKNKVTKEELRLNEWNCIKKDYDEICYPKGWIEKSLDNVIFYFKIDDTDKKQFYVLLRHNKEEIGIANTKGYLKEVYSQLVSDTIEPARAYSTHELVYNRRVAYYSEYETEYNGQDYICFSAYTDDKQDIYDFSLKVKKIERDKYYKIFQNMLYNYKHFGIDFFNSEDELKKYKEVDLSTL